MALRDKRIKAYGTVCYLISRVALLYAIGFVGNIAVPRSIDDAVAAPVHKAVVVNLLLLGLFAFQQSLMADPVFRKWLARFVALSVERSTYVLFGSLALFLVYWQWRTMPTVVWDVPTAVGRLGLHVVFWLGWAIVAAGAVSIKHFDWFNSRRVYFAWRKKCHSDTGFRCQLPSWLVQHPIMLGFVIAFWATPVMTAGYLLFAVAATGYIVMVVREEERDLRRQSALNTAVIAELSNTFLRVPRQATVNSNSPRPSVNGFPSTGGRERNGKLGLEAYVAAPVLRRGGQASTESSAAPAASYTDRDTASRSSSGFLR